MEAELVAIAQAIPPQLPARQAAYAYLTALMEFTPSQKDQTARSVAIGQESVAFAWLKASGFEDIALKMKAAFRARYPKAWLPH